MVATNLKVSNRMNVVDLLFQQHRQVSGHDYPDFDLNLIKKLIIPLETAPTA